ncbi:MAG: metal-dependent hydrolase [Xylophilus ampelinus]
MTFPSVPASGPAAAAAPAAPDWALRLTIRKLEIDLSQGFARRWHGGDAFRSQFFNALSMSFPVGEQFFIDSVREAARRLPDGPAHAGLRATVQDFIGQEATHRRIHGLFNEELARQGLDNRWQHWARRRAERARRLPPLHALAATCAFEHLTAVLADGTLRHPRWLEGAGPTMQTLWRWHAAEETEHRAVAFALFQALGGSHRMRIGWYLYVLAMFALDAGRQTAINLRRDGGLLRPRTWREAAGFFLGRDGLVWRCAAPLARYLRRDFHPDTDRDAASAMALARRWLADNAARYRVVR